uniref:FH2 domain containing 1 n=1 Tax=Ursus maritimus TaxID=29073 RepID=A0A452UMG3_URSMA
MFVSASPRPRNYLLRSHLGKKKRMRSFFWKTIPEEQVRGKTNIWTLAARQQHHYQIDAKTIEELFGQQEDTTTKPSLSRRGGTLNSSFRDAREEITVLDAKRSMNIGIFLKQFKKSPQSIVEDIHNGQYGSETLREFLKLLPESEEVRNLAHDAWHVESHSVIALVILCAFASTPPSHVVRYSSGYRWETEAHAASLELHWCVAQWVGQRGRWIARDSSEPRTVPSAALHCIPLRKEGQRFSKPRLAPRRLPAFSSPLLQSRAPVCHWSDTVILSAC